MGQFHFAAKKNQKCQKSFKNEKKMSWYTKLPMYV